jgi:hypothetical protein
MVKERIRLLNKSSDIESISICQTLHMYDAENLKTARYFGF